MHWCQDDELGASKKWQDVGSAVNGAVANWQLTLEELVKALRQAVGQCQEALLKGSVLLDTNFMYECHARAAVGLAWLGKEFGQKKSLTDAEQAVMTKHRQESQSTTPGMPVPIEPC